MTDPNLLETLKKNFCYIDPNIRIGNNFKCGRFVIVEGDVSIGDNVTIGDFVKIRSGCVLGNNVKLGDYVKFMHNTKIGNNVQFDDYCNTSGYCQLGDNIVIKRQTMIGQATVIEDNVWIGSNVTTNRLKYPVMNRSHENEEGVVIKSGCVVGSKALILAGVTLGKGSWVSTGGVVTKNTEPNFIYLGNPARKLREVPAEFDITRTK